MNKTDVARFVIAGILMAGTVFGVYSCKQKQKKDVAACLASGKTIGECL